MREIKFRVWVTFNNKDNAGSGMMFPVTKLERLYGELGPTVVDASGEGWLISPSKHGDYYLMQYTGLTDMDNEEIYEGDIVEVNEEASGSYSGRGIKEVVPIVFENGSFILKGTENSKPLQNINYCDTVWCTVIGNIYENPELVSHIHEDLL